MPLEYTYISVTSSNICDGAFLTLLADLFFTRHVKFPMRYIEMIKLHLYWILHWVLTSMQSWMSLHCPLLAKVITLSSALNFCVIILLIVSMPKYLYGRGDYESMTHELLNIDWAHLFEGQDMNVMWLCFHTKLLNLIDKYIPVETFNFKPKPKWLNLF